MGAQQSKEELLYQQVNYGNIEGIRALRSQGAGLEVSHTIIHVECVGSITICWNSNCVEL